jgi:hypothetical protein
VARLNADKSRDILNVGMRFGGRQALAFIDAGVEGERSQPVAKYAPGRIDASGASDVDEGESLGF